MKAAKYMGAVLLILKLKQPLTSIYWMNIPDRSIPFVATIEQTNFIPPEVYNHKRVLYVSNYLDPASPYFQMSATSCSRPIYRISENSTGVLARLGTRDVAFQGSGSTTHRPAELFGANPRVSHPLAKPLFGEHHANLSGDRGTNYSVRLGRVLAQMLDQDVKNGNDWP